jgi:hypothetical protein
MQGGKPHRSRNAELKLEPTLMTIVAGVRALLYVWLALLTELGTGFVLAW